MNNEKHPSRVRKKKVKKRRRILLIMIPVFIVLLSTLTFGIYLYTKAGSEINKAHVEDDREKSDLREEKVNPKVDDVSVLFIGVDNSKKRDFEGNARSDALMLATLNKDEKSVKLLSIPRDSYVYVPEVGYNTKINHAHAFGGPSATMETVEKMLDVPVDYYVRMDFEAFIDVVNALNGITVDVPYEFSEQDSNDTQNAIHLNPGEQLLNGEEALALARTRKHDSDLARGERQQEIIKAVIDKTTSLNSVLKYDDVIEALGENMATNMTFSEMRSFASYGTSGNLDVETLTLEGSDTYIEGTYYYQINETSLANTRLELKEHLSLTAGELPSAQYNAQDSDDNSSDETTSDY